MATHVLLGLWGEKISDRGHGGLQFSPVRKRQRRPIYVLQPRVSNQFRVPALSRPVPRRTERRGKARAFIDSFRRRGERERERERERAWHQTNALFACGKKNTEKTTAHRLPLSFFLAQTANNEEVARLWLLERRRAHANNKERHGGSSSGRVGRRGDGHQKKRLRMSPCYIRTGGLCATTFTPLSAALLFLLSHKKWACL